MKRCFLAIDLPDELINRLLQREFLDDSVRWLKPEQLHLTLAFIGKISELTEKNLILELKKVNEDSLTIELDKPISFPNPRKARVLCFSIRKSHELQQLQQKICVILANLGIEIEKREFIPHITVGRVRKGVSHTIKLTEKFNDSYSDFKSAAFVVDKFALYESKLSCEGAKYLQIKKFTLH